MALMSAGTLEFKVTGPYVSCVGLLCITISLINGIMEPLVLEIVGVSDNEEWVVIDINDGDNG